MIKKYTEYINESLLNKLEGPSNEEIIEHFFKNNLNSGLIKSCVENFLPGVKYAMKIGVNIDYNEGEPLRCAIFHGHNDLVKFLLENGSDLHLRDDKAISSAILWNSDILKYFLENYEIDIHKENYYKICGRYCSFVSLQLLIDHGATYDEVRVAYDESRRTTTNTNDLKKMKEMLNNMN